MTRSPPGQKLLYVLLGVTAGLVLGVSFRPFVLVGFVGAVCLVYVSTKSSRALFTLLGLLIGLIRVWLPISAPQTQTQLFSRAQTWASQRLNSAVPYPASALAAGVLMGYRAEVPKQLTADMRASGLSHMLAVSGYNVSIVASLVVGLLRKVASKRVRTCVVVVAVCLYVLICGAGPPVVRAGLMGGVASLILLSSRPTNARRALLVAVALLLLWNPYLGRFDVGFQLSVAATAGLVFLGPHLQHFAKAIPNPIGMRDAALTSLAASLSTLPVVAATFGTFPLYGIPANILAAPLVPVSMLTGLVALLGGDGWLGHIAGVLCALIANLLAHIAHTAATLPGAQKPIGLAAALIIVGAGFAVLTIARIVLYKYKKHRALSPLLS